MDEGEAGGTSGGAQVGARLLIACAGLLVACEMVHQGVPRGAFNGGLGAAILRGLWPAYRVYAGVRAAAVAHPVWAVIVGGSVATGVLLLYRQWLIAWHNHILPRIAGTHFEQEKHTFPWADVDLVEQMLSAPPGSTFIGMTPNKGRFGKPEWEPVYLSERERSTHVQAIGKTGSGKTVAALMPMAFQDLRAGKGMVFISGKGSNEEIEMIKGLAQATGRVRDLRIFCLPAWNRAEVFTHTYNMLYVRPRTPGGEGGDAVALAERVFKVLPLGDNVYYNQQALIFWRNLIRAAHGVVYTEAMATQAERQLSRNVDLREAFRKLQVDYQARLQEYEEEVRELRRGSGSGTPAAVPSPPRPPVEPRYYAGPTPDYIRARLGHGVPFNMRDIALCLKGVGANSPVYQAALAHVLDSTLDREAANEIRSQQDRLGREIHKVLSGLVGACDQFLSPMVNAYHPDIVMEEVLEKNLIVYAQLPDNLFKVVAPSLGKVLLQDIQQEGSLRQVYRASRAQSAFSVIVDEFARFSDVSILSSLSQLRDANVQFTLAHQSPADLEIVGKEFAVSVWDNTRAKILLNQDNPQLCEMVAKSLGTAQETKLTVKLDAGPLFTTLQSRTGSSRQVESYRLHPNKIRALRRFGQAYLYSDETLSPVVLAALPKDVRANYPLPRYGLEGLVGGQNLGQYLDAREADERAAAAAAGSAAKGSEDRRAAKREGLAARVPGGKAQVGSTISGRQAGADRTPAAEVGGENED